MAKSLTDYIFRFLGNRFAEGGPESLQAGKVLPTVDVEKRLGQVELQGEAGDFSNGDLIQQQSDAPTCADCGSIMIRNGACYKCMNCGATSGCS